MCLTPNEILKGIDQKIDFISLDVEGHEFDVLVNDSPASILLKQQVYSKRFILDPTHFTPMSVIKVYSW